jgi:putative hydrolase of the HAD superfamily
MNSDGLRAILFDAGNTLVYVDPRRMAEILRGAGVDTDGNRVALAELTARHRLHEGIAQGAKGTEPELWRSYLSSLFSGSGVSDDALETVADRVREEHARDHLWTHVVPGTAATLAALRDAGYRLAVISNADGRVEGVLVRAGLRDYFEFVIDSELVGVEKPDAAIFRQGCDRLGLPPEACLYVGDLYPVDYLGAMAAGLRAILIDPLGLHGGRASTVTTLAELPGVLGRAGVFP